MKVRIIHDGSISLHYRVEWQGFDGRWSAIDSPSYYHWLWVAKFSAWRWARKRKKILVAKQHENQVVYERDYRSKEEHAIDRLEGKP